MLAVCLATCEGGTEGEKCEGGREAGEGGREGGKERGNQSEASGTVGHHLGVTSSNVELRNILRNITSECYQISPNPPWGGVGQFF